MPAMSRASIFSPTISDLIVAAKFPRNKFSKREGAVEFQFLLGTPLYGSLGLVLIVGSANFAADAIPVGIAQSRQRREVPSGRQMHRAIDGDGLAGQVIAAIGHQEHRKIGKFAHLAHAP